MIKKLFFCLALMVALPLAAYEVDDVTVPDACQLEANQPKLQLQGAGIRTKAFFDVYVGAFYAAHPIKTTTEALSDPGPKRMWVHMIYDDLALEKFRKAWRDGIHANNDDSVVAENQKNIDQLMKSFTSDMRKGDILTIDYLPGTGTRITINKKVTATIPGDTFYTLVLSAWMGENPPSEKFQKALLELNA